MIKLNHPAFSSPAKRHLNENFACGPLVHFYTFTVDCISILLLTAYNGISIGMLSQIVVCTGTWRQNNIVSTSMRRRNDIVSNLCACWDFMVSNYSANVQLFKIQSTHKHGKEKQRKSNIRVTAIVIAPFRRISYLSPVHRASSAHTKMSA